MNLFVTDYDDTLYQNDDGIKENIKNLKKLQKKKFLIVISTGRSYPSIKLQVDKYQIPYDYLSCADGSIIYDTKGQIIYKSCINDDIIEILQSFYEKLPYEEIQFSYPEGYLNTLKGTQDLLGINICLSSNNYNKKIVKEFMKLKKKYPNYNYLAYQHINFSYLCIKPINISKSFAISILKDKFKIKKEDIYVIGDSSNDIEMIKDFNGVRMTNSYPEIIKLTNKSYNTVSDYINEIITKY